jgi:hypothetical protein
MPSTIHASDSTNWADMSTWPPNTIVAGATTTAPVTDCTAAETPGSATPTQRFWSTVPPDSPSMPAIVSAMPAPTPALPSSGARLIATPTTPTARPAHSSPSARSCPLATASAVVTSGDRPSITSAPSPAGTPSANPP